MRKGWQHANMQAEKAAIGTARVTSFRDVKRTLRRSLPALLQPPQTSWRQNE
jgi:hypothetical protein